MQGIMKKNGVEVERGKVEDLIHDIPDLIPEMGTSLFLDILDYGFAEFVEDGIVYKIESV